MRNQRNILFAPLFLLLTLLSAAGCGHSDSSDDADRADSLYTDICRLTKIYADSMAHAADSAATDTLIMNFEAKAAAIYNHYPPGTDQLFGEDRNDTIYLLTRKLIEARNKVLCPPDSLPADSVATDSVAPKPQPQK